MFDHIVNTTNEFQPNYVVEIHTERGIIRAQATSKTEVLELFDKAIEKFNGVKRQ